MRMLQTHGHNGGMLFFMVWLTMLQPMHVEAQQTCSQATPPDDAVDVSDCQSTTLGDACVVSCKPGYQAASSVLTCVEQGGQLTLIGSYPKCLEEITTIETRDESLYFSVPSDKDIYLSFGQTNKITSLRALVQEVQVISQLEVTQSELKTRVTAVEQHANTLDTDLETEKQRAVSAEEELRSDVDNLVAGLQTQDNNVMSLETRLDDLVLELETKIGTGDHADDVDLLKSLNQEVVDDLDEIRSQVASIKTWQASATSALDELQTLKADMVKLLDCSAHGLAYDKETGDCRAAVAVVELGSETCTAARKFEMAFDPQSSTPGIRVCDGSRWRVVHTPLPGTSKTNPAKDCEEVYDAGFRTDGLFYISVGQGQSEVQVCDLENKVSLGGDGSSKKLASASCATLREWFNAPDGMYYILVQSGPKEMQCDMSGDGELVPDGSTKALAADTCKTIFQAYGGDRSNGKKWIKYGYDTAYEALCDNEGNIVLQIVPAPTARNAFAFSRRPDNGFEKCGTCGKYREVYWTKPPGSRSARYDDSDSRSCATKRQYTWRYLSAGSQLNNGQITSLATTIRSGTKNFQVFMTSCDDDSSGSRNHYISFEQTPGQRDFRKVDTKRGGDNKCSTEEFEDDARFKAWPLPTTICGITQSGGGVYMVFDIANNEDVLRLRE